MTNKKIIRNNDQPVQKNRFVVQVLFTLLCIWIGIEMYLFISYLESGGSTAFYRRPPGVDGFLPISSFMSFYVFITTGSIHQAHPAGMIIFGAIVLVSVVFGKSFCSWLCPAGLISESAGDFGDRLYKKLFKRTLRLPRWLDYPLRSLKYLLLAFLFYSVFFLMSSAALQAFLDSSYNQVADIKMYYFFADISRFSLIVIAALFVLSIFIRNFWCRFLCPYGALLGMLSFLSPYRIKRDPVSCIDCELCAKACPSSIKVDKVISVISDECSSCMSCVDACPVAGTLEYKSVITGKSFPKKKLAFAVAAIFMIVTGIGMATGNWQNDITKEEYLLHYNEIGSYGHPTGTEAVKKFNEKAAVGERGTMKNINKN